MIWGIETRTQKRVCMCVCVYGAFLHFLWGAERQNGPYTQTSICILRVCFTVERLNSQFKREFTFKMKKSQIRVNFDPPKCRCVCVLDVCMYGIFAVNTRKKYTQTSKHTNILIVFTGFQGFLKVKWCLKSHFPREFTYFST